MVEPLMPLVGQPLRPFEDGRLVRGQGRYLADLRRPGMVQLVLVRSPYAHARLDRLDTRAAAGAPGVLAVLTAADLPPAFSESPVTASETGQLVAAPVLAREVVRMVGQPVAAVVAETLAQALDAAALVQVDYSPLPAVADPEAALAPGAPLVHPALGTNRAFTLRRGDAAAADRAFAQAAVRIRQRFTIPRLAGVPLEPVGALAEWDAAAGRLTVWCPTQAPWRVHQALVRALDLPAERVRVIAPDVGGGFGVRGPVYPEYLLVAWAARHLGRPVRWLATRREDFLATPASRETVVEAELAASPAGRIQGLRVRALTNLGAYAGSEGPARRIVALLTGPYDIPAAAVEVAGVYTHTGPTGAYRGAGRPEAAYIIERLVETLARDRGLDPAEVRRRNFVPPTAFPYRTALGTVYDSGNYAAALDRALALVDYAALRARQRAQDPARDRELLGVGLMSYIEPTGGGWESGRVRVEPDGRVVVVSGSVPQGQGHATTFAQIVADRLGVPVEAVVVRQGDTADGLPGIGTFGSRSLALGGSAVAVAATEVVERARRIAAHLLEAAPDDVRLQDGRFVVAGVPGRVRAVTWAAVARAALSGDLPPDLAGPLQAETRFEAPGEAFAFGTGVAVVTVDRETGVVRLRRLALVHDCGPAVNPRLVAAQLHGGLAQGAGEALGEWLRYDPEGQLLTGSLLDYWLPHADDLPFFDLAETVTPSPLNPLGAKGVGEAGTIAAPAAIVNAVLDALWPLGVRDLTMPLTPERVWQAIQRAARPGGGG